LKRLIHRALDAIDRTVELHRKEKALLEELFTGAYNFHSRFECVSVSDIVLATETLFELVKLWAGEQGGSAAVRGSVLRQLM
jgi:hypothetical protein